MGTSRKVAAAAKARRKAPARKPKRPGRKKPVSAAPAASAGQHGIRIRMYRLGVGDCFLLRFPKSNGESFCMLIDCGVHQAQSGGAKRMLDVVADIKTETNGHLDVVVGTHEHWDHLSGFLQAKDLFKNFTVGEVWCAWTENASDAFAKSLMDKKGRALKALGAADTRFRMAGGGTPLTGLLGFFGDTTGAKLKQAGDVLAALAGNKANIRYREPGEAPIELPGVNARIFVLGPPRDKAAIARSAPTKTGDEVYSFGAYGEALDAIEGALGAEAAVPFDDRFSVPLTATKNIAFFRRHYWANRAAEKTQERADTTQAWRRIDADWLDATTALALKLDEDTNNTSLVMAIELGDPDQNGPVLLFAADAQVGNWLSWQNVEWKDFHGRHVTGPDLLRRTKIYKVGHHASHNATLKKLGLEMMDALELALVPTDAAMAKKVKWGTLPWPPLLDNLGTKTAKRVIRTDQDLAGPIAGYPVTATKLYYEVEL